MTDQEIYEFAAGIADAVLGDYSAGIYADLGGTLTVAWSTEPKFSAWAESDGNIESPPHHKVVLCYELARKLYRDVEAFHQFMENEFFQNQYQALFEVFEMKPKLSDEITRPDSIKNIFIGAFTFVIFHELGHLIQEHGYIRKKFGDIGTNTHIEDCESDGEHPLTGMAAIISHVTEFAADVEAVNWCIVELMRHFLPLSETDKELIRQELPQAEWGKGHPMLAPPLTEAERERQLFEFQSNLFRFVCGISCAFYRFYGERTVTPEAIPQGSHPTPIRRLELCLPNIFERLDSDGGNELHGLNRSQLVELCSGAADSAGIFWLWRYSQNIGIPDNFIVKEVMADTYFETYWAAIVSAWDEVEPIIKDIRRFGFPGGMLFFTDYLRSHLPQSS